MGKTQIGWAGLRDVITQDPTEQTAVADGCPPTFTTPPDDWRRPWPQHLRYLRGAPGARGWDRAWASDPASVSATRAWTRAVLSRWRLGSVTDYACYCVSELVTNAVVHAPSPDPEIGITVRVWFWEFRALLIEVIDGSETFPTIDARGVLAPSTSAVADMPTGRRGLLIVDALADVLAWEAHPYGKSVWVRFTLDPYGLADGQ